MAKGKYRTLFSPKHKRPPGPKGPKKELIQAVVALKRRSPNWGCPRIAQQITLAFGVAIDKDVVRRILSVHYSPESGSGALHGSPFFATGRTVCGAAICTAVNPQRCEPVGFSS
jgi:hypothetical protein